MNINKLPLWQLIKFTAVGLTAAATNLLIVIVLVETESLAPLSANLVAFVCAFWVSYFGHHYLTFSTNKQHRKTLPAFLITASLGFCTNETILLIGTHGLHQHYIPTLTLGIMASAILVFLLSKYWALKHER